MQGSLLPLHTQTQTQAHTTHTHACSYVRRYAQVSMCQAYTCAHVSPRQTHVCTGPEQAPPTQAHVYVGRCTRIYTHMKAPHTRVRRYAGEPTPSMLTCTHTQAQAGPHTCVFVQTLTCPHAASRDAQTPESVRHHAETHTCRHAHARTLTRGAPHGRPSPARCTQTTDFPRPHEEIPAVPPLRLQINTANPRAPQNSAILWWQQDHMAFFPLGRAASKMG